MAVEKPLLRIDVEFRPVPVDLRTVVSDAVGNFTPATTRKDIALRVDLDPQLTRAVVDPARLRQVLHNYLSNAVKFSDRGGSITVRLRAEDGRRFRIEVEDTGAGIRPEDLERLFVEFQQLDARLAGTYQGTGMGLALTRRIVEAQGGQVGASSEPGKGSTFYAVLPLLTPVTRHEGQDHWQR